MIKALAAAMLLFSLGACGSVDARPAAGKSLPPAPPPPSLPDEGVACAADVKQCADGSYVSRNPDNGCTFDVCPGANNN